ncbi:Zinc-finger domain of monoamine-oxidase A repressor R1 protein [Raphanus sativus]|nr:Zinc-finger domain of monoamine-oxidase A repressor R1 protein [Raphanus sativus]
MATENENAKTKEIYCHQCRQKRSDAVGTCVTKVGTKTCVLKFCPTCLLSRYGEIGEEVALNDNWVCPRCRKICNCSSCMINKGEKPTGMLTATAKKNGCSNVYEFLKKEGSDKYFYRGKMKPENVIGQGNCAEETNDSSAGCSEENAAARAKRVLKEKEEFQLEEVKLPQGIQSITVSNVDLDPDNAGSVLQFLEFCLTFREALGLRDGQAQLVVHEVLSGRSTGSQEYSTLTQTIIQLLTLILVDRGDISVGIGATDDRWFTILGECLAESEVKLDDFPPQMFQKGISEYAEMDSFQKLKLLNFVCDEALGTSVMRNFIENYENPKYVEKKKKAEETLNAAEAKEKQLYQKIKDDFAKTEADNNGVALTIEQRVAIISQMSDETEEVHFEMKKALEMQPKGQEYNDALRTNPVELDDNGLILWNLKSYNEEPTILLQDLGSCSNICPHEKWYSFSSQQKPQVEKYITFKRKKSLIEKKMEKKRKAVTE